MFHLCCDSQDQNLYISDPKSSLITMIFMKDDHTENCFEDTIETQQDYLPQVLRQDDEQEFWKERKKWGRRFNDKLLERI